MPNDSIARWEWEGGATAAASNPPVRVEGGVEAAHRIVASSQGDPAAIAPPGEARAATAGEPNAGASPRPKYRSAPMA